MTVKGGISLPDTTHARALQHARSTGTTLSGLIDAALKAELTRCELAEHAAMLAAADDVDRLPQRAQSRGQALAAWKTGWVTASSPGRLTPRQGDVLISNPSPITDKRELFTVVSSDLYNTAGGPTVLVAEIEPGSRYRATAYATETNYGVVLADRVVWLPMDMLGEPFGQLTAAQRDRVVTAFGAESTAGSWPTLQVTPTASSHAISNGDLRPV